MHCVQLLLQQEVKNHSKWLSLERWKDVPQYMGGNLSLKKALCHLARQIFENHYNNEKKLLQNKAVILCTVWENILKRWLFQDGWLEVRNDSKWAATDIKKKEKELYSRPFL